MKMSVYEARIDNWKNEVGLKGKKCYPLLTAFDNIHRHYNQNYQADNLYYAVNTNLSSYKPFFKKVLHAKHHYKLTKLGIDTLALLELHIVWDSNEFAKILLNRKKYKK